MRRLKVRAFTFISFALMLCNASFAGTCSEIESRTAAHDFYAELGSTGTFGIPTKEALSKLKPLTTKSLHALLSGVVKAGDEYDRLPAKDKEAPPYEGSLFSSSVEGYTNFYVSGAVPGSNNAEIYILLQYAQHFYPYYADKPGIMEWKEKVKIIKEGKVCLVDDIYFLPENHDQSLKDRLKKIVSESEYEAAYYKKKGAASHK
jgi:hypothetical protein